MKTKFEDFLNESIRDKMEPVSQEYIQKKLDEYKEGQEVRIFEDIIGKTPENIILNKYGEDNDTKEDDYIKFVFTDGEEWKMYHQQDCCEQVTIDDIIGDLDDLIGEPLRTAEVVSAEDPNASESGTYTFYKFASIKGYVDIRWHGSSNGYYSEYVSFEKIK